MLNFVPLHMSALERSEGLLQWVRGWSGQSSLSPLVPEEWFDWGHGLKGGEKNADGVWIPKESGEKWFLWAPPPAAADVVVDEMNVSRHKRTDIHHIFIAPRLMTFLWRKKLQKLCDIVFEVPAGARPFWPSETHEPLIVGIILPFLPHSPWQVKYSKRFLGMDRTLRELWKEKGKDERSVLCQLFKP